MSGIEQDALAAQRGHGREAATPVRIPFRGWRDIGWRVFTEIGKDRVTLIAAGVTYFLVLAMVPALTALVAIYGLFNDPADVVGQLSMLDGVVPGEALGLIKEQLVRLTTARDASLGLTLVISLAIALWSASSGVKALFEAMNVAYDETEKRGFFTLNLLALGFTLGGLVAIAVLLAVVVLLPAALQLVYLGSGTEWLIRVLSYAVMAGAMLFCIAALYRWGPSREVAKWRWVTPGALVAVVGIILISVLFSWYVANFGHYDATYGSLGALIGLLTWLWLIITMTLVGAELNSEVEHQTARDSTTGPELPRGQRGAVMADEVGSSLGWTGAPENRRAGGDVSLAKLAIALPALLLVGRLLRRKP